MRFLLLVALTLKVTLAFTQYEAHFIPSPFQDTIPPEVYKNLKRRLENDKAGVAVKGKQGDFIKTLYDQRFEYVVRNFNEGYFGVDHPLTVALRKISDRIHQSNPDLAGDVSFYLYRSGIPNAISFGEGTVGIMLGLLERLETEDQVAYVLCHELAHYYARHAEQNFASLAALNYDKDLKHRINDIKSSPYGRYSKLKELFQTLGLSVTRHSRRSEFEADSLGLTYYLKTGYNRYAPLRVMQILEKADKGLHTGNIDFKRHFNFKSFPFKESWTAYSVSDIQYSVLDRDGTDTLQTHPNCKRRFDRLLRQLGLAEWDDIRMSAGTDFSAFSRLASFEIVNSHYYFKEYGKALFHSLLLADLFPADPYPHAMIAKSLYQLYKAQKDHTLHKVLELPHPRFDENYNRFLAFIGKLRLHELANLAYGYATTQPPEFYSNEEFIHALWQCSSFEFSEIDGEKVAHEYEQLYPDGKYLQEMINQK